MNAQVAINTAPSSKRTAHVPVVHRARMITGSPPYNSYGVRLSVRLPSLDRYLNHARRVGRTSSFSVRCRTDGGHRSVALCRWPVVRGIDAVTVGVMNCSLQFGARAHRDIGEIRGGVVRMNHAESPELAG